MSNIPNTFVTEEGAVIFVNYFEMTPEEIGLIARAKAICNKIEKKYGSNDIDQLLMNAITYKEMTRYISARRDLILMGYSPEDWKS